jgi:hypothetical protein
MPAAVRGGLVAIVTTLYLPQGRNLDRIDDRSAQNCGIVKWCHDMTRFAAALPEAVRAQTGAPAPDWARDIDVVISTNVPGWAARECARPSVRLELIDEAFIQLAARFARSAFDRRKARAASLARGIKWHITDEDFSRANLVKWWVMQLTRYELVLAIDNDIDVYINGFLAQGGADGYLATAARAWAEELPRFRANGSVQLLASPDVESAINGGILWLKPSRARYDEGVALLRSNVFSVELGFNRTGRPRAVLRGEYAALEAVRGTRMWQLDSWNFVCGASDQGLLTRVFAASRAALAYATRADYVVRHYWASSKPWLRNPSCLPYFHALGLLDSPGDEQHQRGRGLPPRVLPLLADAAAGLSGGLCMQFFEQQAHVLVGGLPKRWRCRGANFRVF